MPELNQTTVLREIVLSRINTDGSVESSQEGVSLSNDSDSPGANKVYGTDENGIKGWKADSSGGASEDITFTPVGNIAATDVQAAIEELDTDKQAALVSGTNIKTINGASVLGSGNLTISADGTTREIFGDVVSTINVATSRELNIWWDAISKSGTDGLFFEADYSGGGAKDKERSLRITPTSTSSLAATLKAYDRNRSEQESVSITINVVDKTRGTGTKNILFIGDSLLADDDVITEIGSLITTDGGVTANFIGTQGSGLIRHECSGGYGTIDYAVENPRGASTQNYRFTVSGISTEPVINTSFYTNNGLVFTIKRTKLSGGSGIIECTKSGSGEPEASGDLTKTSGTGDATITYSEFTTVSFNPFWEPVNDRIDFQNYVSFWNLSAPDFIVIQLGINDVGVGKVLRTDTELNTTITYLTSIVAAAISATTGYPSAKIIICLEPISGLTKDGFAANYSMSASKQAYEMNLRALHAKQIQTFDAGAYNANVSVCPVVYWVDRTYGYIRSETAASSRTTTTIEEDANAVHPGDDGQEQQADAIYSHLRSLF